MLPAAVGDRLAAQRPEWPRSGQSGRAAVAGREAAGAAEGREVAMRPKAAR